MLKCLNTFSKLDSKNAKLPEMVKAFQKECKSENILKFSTFTRLDVAQKEKLSGSVVEFIDDLIIKLTSNVFAG